MHQLDQLLQRLIQTKVEFVLVGGLAVRMHGSSLVTEDADVCCRFSVDNLMRLQAALADLHPVHRMRPDIPLALTPETSVTFKNLYLRTDCGVLDCLGNVLGVGDYDEVYCHSTVMQLPIGEMRILDMETLITAKRAMARPHDLEAVRHLQLLIQERARLSKSQEC